MRPFCPKSKYFFKYSLILYSRNAISSYTNKALNKKIFFFARRAKYFNTIMILSFRTEMPGQTMQTQIRLLLEE